MIYTYKELTSKGYSDYRIKKLLNNKLFMLEKGIYSTTEDFNYLELITKKHPNAIITLESACYCYGLLNKEPIYYVIATKQKDRKIKDKSVKQIFMSDKFYNVGVNVIKYKGFNVKIYDLERLLIEIVRYKTKFDYDIYMKIIDSYKRIKSLLNKEKLNNYIEIFNDEKITNRIKIEVFQI